MQELSLSPPGLDEEMTLRISRSTAASCSSERSQVHLDQCSSWVRDLSGSILRS